MKRIVNTALIVLASLYSKGQFYAAQWAVGDLPVTLLDFTADSLTLDSISNPYLFFLTDANICDENGDFLYNTNGIYIFDRNGDVLQNGAGINPCDYTAQWVCCGLDIQQAALFIPQPGNTRYYYLFHFSNDNADSSRPATIYYSLIDKEANGGLGAVIEKNDTVFHTSELRGGGMTACKHANGRDYWLIMGASVINTFYKFLITPDSIYGPYSQGIGPEFPLPFDNAYSRFSQDGSKYVTGVGEGPVLVMDFDRCTGEFSNPLTIFNQACHPPQTSCSGSVAVEFSQNNRFVYVSDVINLNQYDLSSSNVQDSVVQIYAVDSGQYAELDMLQLAPDGKIYLSTWNGLLTIDSIHVINNPNAKGDSCNFRYAEQPTYTNNELDMPNMINYSLGPLIGSGCDTIPDSVLSVGQVPLVQNNLRVLPNPTDKNLYVQMSNTGNYEFQLLSPLGQVIDIKESLQKSVFDTEWLAGGIYFIKAIDKNNTANSITKKVIITH
jgi:hypothetical protein